MQETELKLLADSCDFSPDIYDFSLPVKMYDEYPFQTNFCGIRTPIPVLLNSTKAIGMINSQPDRDGVIRRSKLIYRLQDHLFPQMSFSVWKESHFPNEEITIKDNKIIIANQQIPFDKNGDYLINWYGIRNGERPFKSYSFKAVIASASAWLQGNKPILDPNLIKDKYVIVGATAAGLLDLKTNPYEKVMPGMEIWATQLSNFIIQDFIKQVPGWINFFYTFLIIFIVFYAISNFHPQKANFIAFSLLIFTFLLNFFLWKTDRILMNLLMPVIGFLISYLIINTVSYLLEGKSKRAIRKLFSRYLHEDVIKQLEEEPDQIQLGGEEIDATVFYTDIYDFTTISEDKLPSELVTDLNKYFEKLIEFVFEYDGLLDKYTGDGIMVLFGAPISREDHALLACRAANAHRLYRNELKKKTELSPMEQFHLGTRTGINSGRFVAGNIGGEKRMDYTAFGDTVNLAARLEGVNKIYQTNIIISENTFKQVKDEFLCRELDSLKVKGRNQPTKIYELICSYEEMTSQQKPDWILKYEKALNFLAVSRKGKRSVPDDHWALIATQKLFSLSEKHSILIDGNILISHTVQICESILDDQIMNKTIPFYGGFSPEGKLTHTSTRLEGLLAAIQILSSEFPIKNRILNSIHLGMNFLVTKQITSGENSGAFTRAIIYKDKDHPDARSFNRRVTEIRIDYVQHALCAMIEYLEYIK